MEYAIIKTGGKQIKVTPGSQIWIEKIDGDEKKKIEFKDVLVISKDNKIHIGKPILKKSKVVAKIEKQGKHKKIKILRTKAKSNWKRELGHRQPYTRLLIDEIWLEGKLITSKIPQKKDIKKVENTKTTSKDLKKIEKTISTKPKTAKK